MSNVMVRVSNVSKRYRIGEASVRHDSVRDALTAALLKPWRVLFGRQSRQEPQTFLALRDVSFEVDQGEVLGIIGRNGAGKSTLLKVLSRITEPTSGRVEAYGRVGSLLEVGTGFHPDLTGRENIYLNGSILGMRRTEVDRKFDEIVSFSGVEEFLDTPVKRYSSGMFVRLAFAVAAHLDPEILIIDEVLAVGDIEFQRRCLRRMEAAAKEGRTVILVSHNVGTVQAFCSRALLLKEGALVASGEPSDVVRTYLRDLESRVSEDLATRTDRFGEGDSRFERCEVMGDGSVGGIPISGRPVTFVFTVSEPQSGLACMFTIYDRAGNPVTHFTTRLASGDDRREVEGAPQFRCELDELLLLPGRYRIDATLVNGDRVLDHLEGAAMFDVEEGPVRGRRVPEGPTWGTTLMPHRWRMTGVTDGDSNGAGPSGGPEEGR